jgi:hypothetical protein
MARVIRELRKLVKIQNVVRNLDIGRPEADISILNLSRRPLRTQTEQPKGIRDLKSGPRGALLAVVQVTKPTSLQSSAVSKGRNLSSS